MAYVTETYDLGTVIKTIWSDGSVTFPPKVAVAPAIVELTELQKQTIRNTLNSVNYSLFQNSYVVDGKVTDREWNILTQMEKAKKVIGGTSDVQNLAIKFMETFDAWNQYTAWQDLMSFRARQARGNTEGGFLADFGKSIDNFIDDNPGVDYLVPSLAITAEAAKHPVEAGLVVFTAGAISTLAPVVGAAETITAAELAAETEVVTTIATTESVLATSGAGAAGMGESAIFLEELLAAGETLVGTAVLDQVKRGFTGPPKPESTFVGPPADLAPDQGFLTRYKEPLVFLAGISAALLI